MIVLGLTGKTGAGKSSIAKIFSDRGSFVIDADVIAREILNQDNDVLKKLIHTFGDDIVDEDGNLLRKVLAKKAFSTEDNTKTLNGITHPYIVKEIQRQIEAAKNSGFKSCVVDAAVLLECDAKNLCDKIIVVACPLEIRLERILNRDSISKENALIRINAQKSDEYYNYYADIIIRNYPPYILEDELEKIFKVIINEK